MITSLTIRHFQGIREGRLEGFTPLTVLVGPNGSGKSTILNAIAICAGNTPFDAIDRVTDTIDAEFCRDALPWLFWKGETGATAVMEVEAHGHRLACQLSCVWGPYGFAGLRCHFQSEDGASGEVLLNAKENNKRLGRPEQFDRAILGYKTVVRRIETYSRNRPSIPDMYQGLVRAGQRSRVNRIVSDLIRGFQGIELLPQGRQSVPHVEFAEHSIPLALAGDGLRLMLTLALELASSTEGVVLLEEPEAHLHPGAMRTAAKAVVATVTRGVQLFLTTHSLEMIDALIRELPEERIESLSLFRLQLEDGTLRSSRLSGSDVAFARAQIEDDLR